MNARFQRLMSKAIHSTQYYPLFALALAMAVAVINMPIGGGGGVP